MYKMQGVVPPMLTPFKENGDLDEKGLSDLVTFLKEKVHGVFITGSYGSGALMDLEERKKVVEVVSKVNNKKVDVVVMVGSTNNRTSVDLAKHAQDQGVDAVAAVGPYYFTHNEDRLLYFYEDLINAVDIPVYLYNNPKFQGYQISMNTIEKLKSIGLHGIKDATFDILTHANYQRLLADENFDVTLGTEAMWLSAVVLGCRAFIPGLGNAFPEICVQMYEEGIAGNYEKCRETQLKVNKLRDIMYLAGSTQLAVYAMLELRGICKAYPRAPFKSAKEEEKQSIKKELQKLGML